MFVTAIALNIRFVGKPVIVWTMGHFRKLNDSIFVEKLDKSSPFNRTHYVVLYPQNGDRVVTIDAVTSLHPVYSSVDVHTVVRANSTPVPFGSCDVNKPL